MNKEKIMTESMCASLIIADMGSEIESLSKILERHLSHPAKYYDITYDGKKYQFYYEFDVEENVSMMRRRRRFINRLISDCIVASTKPKFKAVAWDPIFGILNGANPKDHQFERFNVGEVYQITGEDGNAITSVPLNLDNYQVKENLGMLDAQQI